MRTEAKKFRTYLQHELIKRCERNPKYSLRAFAKQLGIYHATLSAIMSGKRPITSATVRKLNKNLGLSPKELDTYLKDITQKSKPRRTVTYSELTQDTFNAISEWYYDAIMELVNVETFCNDPRWIANVLSITVSEARIAIETLLRLHLIRIDAAGGLHLTKKHSTNILDSNFTNAAMKKYQKQIIEKSSIALDEVSKLNRDHTSTTIAIDPEDLPKIKKIIRNFRYELNAYVQREGVRPKEVYQLQVSIFRIMSERLGTIQLSFEKMDLSGLVARTKHPIR